MILSTPLTRLPLSHYERLSLSSCHRTDHFSSHISVIIVPGTNGRNAVTAVVADVAADAAAHAANGRKRREQFLALEMIHFVLLVTLDCFRA